MQEKKCQEIALNDIRMCFCSAFCGRTVRTCSESCVVKVKDYFKGHKFSEFLEVKKNAKE